VLINCPIDVTPYTGDLDVGLVHEPPVTDRVATGSSCVDKFWCEVLYPPVNGDVINVDASFGEELLNVAVRQAVAQVPAHSQQNHIGREPVSGERSGLNTAATIHRHTLPLETQSVNATVPIYVGLALIGDAVDRIGVRNSWRRCV